MLQAHPFIQRANIDDLDFAAWVREIIMMGELVPELLSLQDICRRVIRRRLRRLHADVDKLEIPLTLKMYLRG